MKIWVTSDTHYGHSNLCKATSKWADTSGCRDFPSIEKMNATIINGINKYVEPDDVLYHLGDWSFGGMENIWNFRKQLSVKKIHLVLGNHDEHIQNKKILPNCYLDDENEIRDGISPRKGKYEDERDDLWDCHAHWLFESIEYVNSFSVGKQKFFLSHYAHRVWDKSHKGVIHLYGHSHATLEDQPWGKSMDVGIDNAYRLFGEYRPFSLDEIVKLMGKREIKILDHHNFRTT